MVALISKLRQCKMALTTTRPHCNVNQMGEEGVKPQSAEGLPLHNQPPPQWLPASLITIYLGICAKDGYPNKEYARIEICDDYCSSLLQLYVF